jgi:hypothetical protein
VHTPLSRHAAHDMQDGGGQVAHALDVAQVEAEARGWGGVGWGGGGGDGVSESISVYYYLGQAERDMRLSVFACGGRTHA